MTFDEKRRFESGEYAPGRRLGGPLRYEAFEEHRELVAAETSEGLARPDLALDAAADLDDQAVAGRVAHRVVEDFEAVEVEEHNRGLAVLALGPRQGEGELVHEVAPVRQARDAVREGEVLHVADAALSDQPGEEEDRGQRAEDQGEQSAALNRLGERGGAFPGKQQLQPVGQRRDETGEEQHAGLACHLGLSTKAGSIRSLADLSNSPAGSLIDRRYL